jgi:hypothetical protein
MVTLAESYPVALSCEANALLSGIESDGSGGDDMGRWLEAYQGLQGRLFDSGRYELQSVQ